MQRYLKNNDSASCNIKGFCKLSGVSFGEDITILLEKQMFKNWLKLFLK